jgi:ADP-ribose pyrophosphatase YjhB (NUDIX family)
MMRFCPDCGTAVEFRDFEQRQRAFCPSCRQIHYAQLKVGAGALIEQDGTLLLIRRTADPFRACWNLPAGYAEADEAPLETVVREVYEEAGLRVEPAGLVDVYYFDDDPRGNGVLIVYRCRAVGGVLRPTGEGADPTLFGASDIPTDLAGGGHDQAIRAWRSAQRPDRQEERRVW